jgi:choline kinase
VLAAGWGSRLRPYTDAAPKALVPLDDEGTSPLHLTLANFAEVGIAEVSVVVGYKAEVVQARRPELEQRYGVRIDLVHNEKALVWNNAYSLLCGLRSVADDVLLVNGDTLHPVSFERSLLAGDGRVPTLSVDSGPGLAQEEMKVYVEDGRVRRISKALGPELSFGEYVGVALLPRHTHDGLAAALAAVVDRDPGLYYEDGFQEYIDHGGVVAVCDTLGAPWTEIDDERDLLRAKEIVCRS